MGGDAWIPGSYDPVLDRIYWMVPAQKFVAEFLATFREFPPRQKPASFSLDQVLEQMTEPQIN